MNLRPELLQHPNIPKPLHGMNPRTIKGKKWWDEKRQEAYRQNNYKCWACGVGKGQGKYQKPWLEAHENYNIDYKTGTVTITEITALCHCCHNFIHSGRLRMVMGQTDYPEEKVKYIFLRGFNILKKAGLEPWYGTAAFYALMFDPSMNQKARELCAKQEPNNMAPWKEWKLVLEGEKYYTTFKDYDAWLRHYGG